jgi:hypothetical protein
MESTRSEVEAMAIALFGAAQFQQALALVDEYGLASHEREVNRVKVAILESSAGKMSRLPYFVKCAKIDYRDLLTGQRLQPMSDEEETEWQASADRLLKLWNAK